MFINGINQATAVELNLTLQDLLTLNALVELSKFSAISEDKLFEIEPLKVRTYHPLMSVSNATLAKRLEILDDVNVIELHKKGNRKVNFRFIPETLTKLYSANASVTIENKDKTSSSNCKVPKKAEKSINHIKGLSDSKLIPSIKNFTPNRIRSLVKLIDNFGEDEVIRGFNMASESEYLTSKLGEGWYTLDWLLRLEKFTMLSEGKYNREFYKKIEEPTDKKRELVMI